MQHPSGCLAILLTPFCDLAEHYCRIDYGYRVENDGALRSPHSAEMASRGHFMVTSSQRTRPFPQLPDLLTVHRELSASADSEFPATATERRSCQEVVGAY